MGRSMAKYSNKNKWEEENQRPMNEDVEDILKQTETRIGRQEILENEAIQGENQQKQQTKKQDQRKKHDDEGEMEDGNP
ncbi:hypothetical protein VNO77_41809 [Canavalia gladiata]|uniref:Uncharacterized protein n=1 Tax=Canavalia gladiata TaxID=3824 RepID=A0AAN9PS52_CANGL